MKNVTQELQTLEEMRDRGSLTAEEFAQAKADLLSNRVSAENRIFDDNDPVDLKAQTRQWSMFLHLSQLLGHFSLVGYAAPVVIWMMKKDELPGIDPHGKNAINWMLSALIYAIVCIPLFFVVIGIPLAILLGVLVIVFPIIAGIKANNGEVWKYPLAIPFFK